MPDLPQRTRTSAWGGPRSRSRPWRAGSSARAPSLPVDFPGAAIPGSPSTRISAGPVRAPSGRVRVRAVGASHSRPRTRLRRRYSRPPCSPGSRTRAPSREPGRDADPGRRRARRNGSSRAPAPTGPRRSSDALAFWHGSASDARRAGHGRQRQPMVGIAGRRLLTWINPEDDRGTTRRTARLASRWGREPPISRSARAAPRCRRPRRCSRSACARPRTAADSSARPPWAQCRTIPRRRTAARRRLRRSCCG